MKKTLLMMSMLAVLLLLGCIQQKAGPDDLSIEAELIVNNNERMSHKDYVLEVVIEKDQGPNMIYPYMPGLSSMGYADVEDEGYYVPSSIGSSGKDEEVVVKTLQENNMIPMTNTFIGFHVPEKAGKYKVKMYFEKGENFDEMKDFYLIYMHKEKRNSWAKLFEFDIE